MEVTLTPRLNLDSDQRENAMFTDFYYPYIFRQTYLILALLGFLL